MMHSSSPTPNDGGSGQFSTSPAETTILKQSVTDFTKVVDHSKNIDSLVDIKDDSFDDDSMNVCDLFDRFGFGKVFF